jgi:wobble nucleotide-excising tRNase
MTSRGTPTSQPSFKNTLSAGDRTTLALAFFLAQAEQDQALA